MKLCWIVVLVVISIILIFLYSLVAMSSRTERFIEQLMEEEGRKDTDEQDMEEIVEFDRRVNNMSIRKVVAGLLITAGIAIMAVPFFWRTTGKILRPFCVLMHLGSYIMHLGTAHIDI